MVATKSAWNCACHELEIWTVTFIITKLQPKYYGNCIYVVFTKFSDGFSWKRKLFTNTLWLLLT